MKYKIFEKLSDFLHTKLFSKTNIAIIAVSSIVLNIALIGMLYDEQKDFDALSSVYSLTYEYISTSVLTTQNITHNKQQETFAQESSNAASSNSATTSASKADDKTPENAENISSPSKATTAESTEAVVSDRKTYYITDSGKKYHLSGCSYLKNSSNAITLSRAKAEGFTPCSRCIKQ